MKAAGGTLKDSTDPKALPTAIRNLYPLATKSARLCQIAQTELLDFPSEGNCSRRYRLKMWSKGWGQAAYAAAVLAYAVGAFLEAVV